ncbi:MAG: glycerophosphodiester phosphodiesterase [Pseudonocardiales bacterium]
MRRLGGALLAAGIVLGTTTAAASTGATNNRPSFDLQAHRGGIGLRPESSPAAFEYALRLGVTTLELDLQITKDGQAVVTHDRRTNPVVCQDTAPAFPGDPDFPYLGKYVKDLTLAQVKTFDCGTRRPADPTTDRYIDSQIPVPGSKMMTLREVFDLVKRARATGKRGVMLNIETKVEAGAPEQTAPREQFVQVAVQEIRQAGLIDNVTIQSFDWGALMRMRQVEPRLPIVALTNGTFLQTGQPGASPWLGGIDIDDFDGSLVRAAKSFGADAISPVHGDPQGGSILDPGYQPYTTKEMVDEAHTVGMKVITWTVNDIATMNRLIDLGVDGIITDYPDRLRDLLETRGYELPRRFGRH